MFVVVVTFTFDARYNTTSIYFSFHNVFYPTKDKFNALPDDKF